MKTTDELMTMLYGKDLWIVRGMEIVPASTLRNALDIAYDMSKKGITSRIVRQPDDNIVIEPHQIYELWERVGLVQERAS